MAIGALGIRVFLMREVHAKFGNKIDRLRGSKKRFAKTREDVTRSVGGRGFHMTIGTDSRNRTLAREELLSMTIQTGRMFRKLRHIRKGSVAFTDFLPVFGGKLVTRLAREFLFRYVS